MRNYLQNFFVKLTAVATIASTMAISSPVGAVVAVLDSKHTLSRVKASVQADHTIIFTLQSGDDFDAAGGNDRMSFRLDGAFVVGGTWSTADFTFDDGTARTIDAVAEGTSFSEISCTNGANDVAVFVDTDSEAFFVHTCGTNYEASATGATLTLTIEGTGANGTLTNPAAGTSTTIYKYHDGANPSVGDAGSNRGAISITDDDQVSASAVVAPTLTFDIDSGTSQGSNNDGTHTIAIGTIVPGTTKSSDQSGINSIFIDLDTNATGGATVSVKNTNGANGLTSASVAADDIDSTDATMNATDENYGLCVESVTETQVASGSLTKVSPFDGGTCTAGGVVNVVGGLDGTIQNILSVNDAIEGGRAEILVNASANAITNAHDDYADTLTFIATGTF